MIAIVVGGLAFVIVLLGGATDKPLTAVDALMVIGITLFVAGVSDLIERYR